MIFVIKKKSNKKVVKPVSKAKVAPKVKAKPKAKVKAKVTVKATKNLIQQTIDLIKKDRKKPNTDKFIKCCPNVLKLVMNFMMEEKNSKNEILDLLIQFHDWALEIRRLEQLD